MTSNKLLASTAGVCIAGAVVVGAVLGVRDQPAPPAQQPAGKLAPIASTVTVSAPESPVPTLAAAVSSSVHVAKPVQKQQRRAVTNQEPPVTDPTPTDSPSATPDQPDSTLINEGPGSTDESGIRRAPAPSDPIRHGPSVEPLPHAPSPSN